MSFDRDSWDAQRVYVQATLERVADAQEEQAEAVYSLRSDIRLIKFQMMLIGFLTGAVTSAVVSALVSILLKK